MASGERGVLLASAEMLRRKIIPCRPCIDVGYDILAEVRGRFYRVQVKTTTRTKSGHPQFSVCRRKGGFTRDGHYASSPPMKYEKGKIDFFCFLHSPTHSFYVVPYSAVSKLKRQITLRPDSKFRDAWHLMGAA